MMNFILFSGLLSISLANIGLEWTEIGVTQIGGDLFSGKVWYDCGEGNVIAGFLNNGICDDLECLDGMKCVRPIVSPFPATECQVKDISNTFDDGGDVKCDEGYFLRALASSNKDLIRGICGIGCIVRMKCCKYDSNIITVGIPESMYSWSSCFGPQDNDINEWCVVDTDDFITGFHRGDRQWWNIFIGGDHNVDGIYLLEGAYTRTLTKKNIAFTEKDFTISGYWVLKDSCTGCSEYQYSITTGTTNFKSTESEDSRSSLQSDTQESSWDVSVTASVNAYFASASVTGSFGGSNSLTTEQSQSLTTSIVGSIERNKEETKSRTCNKALFYQYVTSVEQTKSPKSYQVNSQHYACLQTGLKPKCAPSTCYNTECQHCIGKEYDEYKWVATLVGTPSGVSTTCHSSCSDCSKIGAGWECAGEEDQIGCLSGFKTLCRHKRN